MHAYFSIHLRANQVVSGRRHQPARRSGSPATCSWPTTGTTAPRVRSRRSRTWTLPGRRPHHLLRGCDRQGHKPADLGGSGTRPNRLVVPVPYTSGSAPARDWRAATRCLHGRSQGHRHALRGGRHLGCPGGAWRCLPRGRIRRLVQLRHDRRARIHRARGRDLRQDGTRSGQASAAAILFGFSTALAHTGCGERRSHRRYGTLFQALPYVLTLVAVAGLVGGARARLPGRIRHPVREGVGSAPVAVARLSITSLSDTGVRVSDEVELYQRTYVTLLRSSGETRLRVLEPSHRAMGSSLHSLADSEELDLGAFLYAISRLPPGIAGAEHIVMGQSAEALIADGLDVTRLGRWRSHPRAGGAGTSAPTGCSRCCSRASRTSTIWCRRWSPTRSNGTRSALRLRRRRISPSSARTPTPRPAPRLLSGTVEDWQRLREVMGCGASTSGWP